MTARARTLTILLLGALAAAAVALAARTVASASSRHAASVRRAGSELHAGSAAHPGAHPAAATRASAGAQLNWLVGASRRLPISATEVAAHVAPVALKAIGGVTGVNQTLSALGPITPTRLLERQPNVAEALGTRGEVRS